MRETYRFTCKNCKLNLLLYKGIEKKKSWRSINYYCFKCHNVSYHDKCLDCGEKLYFAIKIPNSGELSNLEVGKPLELNLECMKCKSKDTKLELISEWN